MATFVALLRGINVGGKHIVPMQAFRELLTKLGCERLATVIQSGNAVFRHDKKPAWLADAIANTVEESFGFRPAVLVLPAAQFAATVAANPFTDEAVDGRFLHTWIAETAIENANLERLREKATADEKYSVAESEFYLYAPSGIGRSKLAADVEKCLGVQGTARNGRTLAKISALLAACD